MRCDRDGATRELKLHYCCWPDMLAAHPLMYLVEEGQRIRCPVCQRMVTHKSSRKAIKEWNRQVWAKRRNRQIRLVAGIKEET